MDDDLREFTNKLFATTDTTRTVATDPGDADTTMREFVRNMFAPETDDN